MKDKFTPDEFRSWMEWVKQLLPAEGHIPGIASYHWENMSKRQVPPWSNFVWTYYDGFDSGYDPTIIDWLAQECLANSNELACRFTGLRYLYELSHYDFENRNLIKADAEAAETQRKYLGDFSSLIQLVKVAELEDWKTIRWEILNAYTIRECWDRALDLYNRAEYLKLMESAELQALRGQFRFLQTFVKPGVDPSSLLWEPKLYSEEDSAWAVILLMMGMVPSRNAPSLQDTVDLDVVRDASHDLEKAVNKKTDLPLLYRSLLARCQFALSEFQKAAGNYVLLKSTSDKWEAVVFNGAWQSAALSYSRGGETQKAIAAYQRVLERFPNEKGIYLRIAELHTRTVPPDPAACCEALRKEMECNPAVDDWQLSTILMLGETGKQSDAAEREIKQLYRSNPGFQQSARLTESLLKVYWPLIDRLKETSKEEWVFGESLVHSTLEFSQVQLRKGVGAFATAVEIELRSRVFENFRESFSGKCSQLERSQRETLIRLTAYLKGNGKLTLGDMSAILEECKRPQEETLREFQRWLKKSGFDLNKVPLLLSKVKDLRNAATHPSTEVFSREHLANIQKWCREILETLLKASTN